jgi:hypothetical protein
MWRIDWALANKAAYAAAPVFERLLASDHFDEFLHDYLVMRRLSYKGSLETTRIVPVPVEIGAAGAIG